MSKKSNNEMIVFKKAKDLMAYTFKMTDSKKRFPKRVTFTFVNRMQNLALDLCSKLLKANDTMDIKTRKEVQSDAIGDTSILLFLIELSWRRNYISNRQCIIWTKKTKDVRYLTMAWYKKT